MEALLQHLLMYLLLLLLQMGNASCGKELLATSALPSHLPPESAALPCSATAANTPGKKLPQGRKKKGCPFVKWAQHVFSFSANPCPSFKPGIAVRYHSPGYSRSHVLRIQYEALDLFFLLIPGLKSVNCSSLESLIPQRSEQKKQRDQRYPAAL